MNADHAPPPKHAPLTIALHWISALAVIGALAIGWTRAALDDEAPGSVLMQLHQTCGLLVLVLLVCRITVRAVARKSFTHPDLPLPMRVAAVGAHLGLYALLLAMPLLGWALTNAHGHDAHLPGLPPLPALVAPDADLADSLDDWHTRLAWTLAALIVAHFGAALFHHFVRRDNVLRSMLPGRVRPAARVAVAPSNEAQPNQSTF